MAKPKAMRANLQESAPKKIEQHPCREMDKRSLSGMVSAALRREEDEEGSC
jgi:hypothetical protein